MIGSMRVVISSTDRLFMDCLSCLFFDSRLQVVASGTDCREAVRDGQRAGVDLVIQDLHGIGDNDIQFVLGAQAFGGFRTIAITDSADLVPDGFTASVTRLETGQALLEKALLLCADVVRSEARRRGRPRMTSHGYDLSHREYELASLIAKGFTNKKIAEAMALKEQSVKNLVSTVIRKLQCENRVQVALQLNRTQQSGPS